MIHFNELKANARSIYETFKKVLDYNTAISQAIESVCIPFTHDQVVIGGKIFASMDEVKNLIREELSEEVNMVVEEGVYYSLSDNEGHIDWYRPKKAAEKINFRFWKRYRKYLTHIKGWPETSVDKIDTISDEIMADIEDPTVSLRPFDRRGLVVGYVQSGKTANFMGIINKAIDSGYRIIIVLAGMHENLREQTQERIDEEVLGIDTNPEEKRKRIGVLTLPGEIYIPIDYFTESNLKPNKTGDFNIKKSRGTAPSSDRPIIFVVKKNKSILNNLRDYFQHWINIFDSDFTYKQGNVNQFNNLPLLIIDDESDQASVNTRASRGKEGEELDPTAINNCIRQILNLFRQKVYIGYTATPFANIFIHHENQHSVLGRDLFPFAFIKTLGAPSNYLGPKEVFGLKDGSENGLPIYREVNDAGQESKSDDSNSAFMPVGHQPDYSPEELASSLKQALKSFVISSAVRWSRGQENKHNTMLIHCTRYTRVQIALAELVDEEMTTLRNAILSEDPDVFTDLKALYERDFVKTSLEMKATTLEWSKLIPFLSKSIKKIEPRSLVINGTVGDILDYKSKAKTGVWVIAIGGDKLSRGLTLEGLTISYFTRNTSLYDTLMQMGRWFGYRNGFEDLCRIYTTPELFRWYRHISTAFEALREEFIEMTRTPGLTPINFGLRVENHPDLMITNVMKMRAAETMLLNYQGTLTETTTLPSDKEMLRINYQTTEELIKSLGEPANDDLVGSYVWLNVPVSQIQEFLKRYQTYKGLPAANSVRINQYIDLQKQNQIQEFLLWNVTLVTLDKGEEYVFAGKQIFLPERTVVERRISNGKMDRFYIKRMQDPKFEFSDFSKQEKKNIDENHYSNRNSRSQSPRKDHPLLMIYVLSLMEGKSDSKVNFEFHPVGFAISWPASNQALPISYVINSVYQELEMNDND